MASSGADAGLVYALRLGADEVILSRSKEEMSKHTGLGEAHIDLPESRKSIMALWTCAEALRKVQILLSPPEV
jgi:hypothetical protein